MQNEFQKKKNLRQVLNEKSKYVSRIGFPQESKRRMIKSYKSPGRK